MSLNLKPKSRKKHQRSVYIRKLKKVREKLPVTCTYGGRSPAEITSTNLRNLKSQLQFHYVLTEM